MTSKRVGLRKFRGNRAARPPAMLCLRFVLRCLDAGQHQPPCRCQLPDGHDGPCAS